MCAGELGAYPPSLVAGQMYPIPGPIPAHIFLKDAHGVWSLLSSRDGKREGEMVRRDGDQYIAVHT